MERRLKQAGYEVATYPSGLHLLLNLPAESTPSCILVDVRIPGMSGPELQTRLSELGSTPADRQRGVPRSLRPA
ncbi:response regulator [Bradyrhizobium valentinum]|uniref:response regulator n=1 Tax=Bradyrhizobium valentinum TaxID=1518501 RepID=UPI0009EC1F33|nr:response regulator [Bradyrhizobium valentinum]